MIIVTGAICNDGSVASYYAEQADYTPGQTIMVYLEVYDLLYIRMMRMVMLMMMMTIVI